MFPNSLGKTNESQDHRETLVQQARGLASGTLAGLCGSNLYSVVDQVQADFVEFCEENSNQYRTWQSAWTEYAKLKKFINKENQND